MASLKKLHIFVGEVKVTGLSKDGIDIPAESEDRVVTEEGLDSSFDLEKHEGSDYRDVTLSLQPNSPSILALEALDKAKTPVPFRVSLDDDDVKIKFTSLEAKVKRTSSNKIGGDSISPVVYRIRCKQIVDLIGV